MLQTEDIIITCAHSVTVVQCGLHFSDRDKPKPVDFRECLRNDFPIERRRPENARRNEVEVFRPKRALFQPDDVTFVWQEGGSVYLRSEAPYNKDKFLQAIDAVVRACNQTRPLNAEPLQLSITITNRFEFMTYEVDQFELHRYFTIAPQPSPQIRRQGIFLFQGELNLRYGDWGGDAVDMQLKFPAYGPGGSNGFADLTIESTNPFVSSLEDATQKAAKELDNIEELTFDATTQELHQLLNWT